MIKNAEKPHVFHTLDILRGVAAIAVMGFHYGKSGFLGANIFPHGYLAVDFFFVLSGFVLAFAYQERLDHGWPTRAFFLTRVVRLYPLYFAGLALGFLFSFLQDHFGRTHLSATTTLLTLLTSLLMIPAFGLEQQSHEATIFPYNKPAWSLFFEIIANVIHALLLRRRSVRFLGVTLCLSGAALAYSCFKIGDLDFGVARAHILYGIVRVTFSYTVGMLLFRIWKSGKGSIHIPPLMIAFLLLLALAAPVPRQFVAFYDLAITIFLFPVLVFCGACSQPSSAFVKSSEWLGIASYAIYVLHVPIANFVAESLRKFTHREPALLAPWPGILSMVLVTASALLLDKYYDVRARAFLRKKLLSGTAVPAQSKPSVKMTF
jgi:peptidoglycan/LPS O-acetylase OafA/YrhL